MENQRITTVGVDQPELPAPPERSDRCTGQALAEIGWKRTAKVAATQLDAGDALALQHLFEAADRCFDFGKLWHGGDMAEPRQGR